MPLASKVDPVVNPPSPVLSVVLKTPVFEYTDTDPLAVEANTSP